MDEAQSTAQPTLELIAKAIADLDSTVQKINSALPLTKTWQREFLIQMLTVDRLLQVLRMTVALEKPGSEIRDAAQQVLLALRAADAFIGRSRADSGTKAGVRWMHGLARRVCDGIASLP